MASKTIIVSKKPVHVLKKKPLSVRFHQTTKYFNEAPDKVCSQMMKKVLFKTITYLILLLGGIITIFPFYWMTVSSLNKPEVMQNGMPLFWGCQFQFKNFIDAWNLQSYYLIGGGSSAYRTGFAPLVGLEEGATLGMYFKNSLIVTTINTVLTIATTLFAAFAISKLKFAGRKHVFTILLMTMMIPGEMLTIQNLVTMNNLVYSEIINKNNIQTLESVIFTNNMEVLYTPVDHDISVTFASMVLCNNNNIDYIYLLTKDEYFSRYRLESNLPYTSQELITSFESKLGSTLTTEFLNGKDTGIFSQLKYDTYSHQYYLEHELRYEDSTYIAKYDFEQEQIVVKTLI